MAKASENVFPKIRFSEESAPATPSTGEAVIYVKTDGKLYLKDDTGAETDLTSGGGGGSGAWTFLDSTELASDTASVTFSSIASTYRKLVIIGYARSDRSPNSTDGLAIQVGNGSVDSGSNYNFLYQRILDAGVTTSRSAGDTQIDSNGFHVMLAAAGANAGQVAAIRIELPGYADTAWNRSVRVQWNIDYDTDTGGGVVHGWWLNTSDAIDIITLSPEEGSNFKSGSKFYLYGVDDA